MEPAGGRLAELDQFGDWTVHNVRPFYALFVSDRVRKSHIQRDARAI